MRQFLVTIHSSKSRHLAALAAIDGSAWIIAFITAGVVARATAVPGLPWGRLALLALVAMAVGRLLVRLPAFDPGRIRRGSVEDALSSVTVWAIVTALVTGLSLGTLGLRPSAIVIVALPVAAMVMLGGRLAWRTLYERLRRHPARPGCTRVIVFGAGDGGEQIIRAMIRDRTSAYLPVALLDDTAVRRTILGIPTLGTRDDIATVAAEHDADMLLIAIPSADSDLIAELDRRGREAGLQVRVLPSPSELLGLLDVGDIRELNEADLLGRAEVDVDMDSIAGYVAGRRVLVTGAGGSIGSELCRQLLVLNPERLIMLDRDESALHALQLSIEGKALLDTPDLVVADIRDRSRIDHLFSTMDIDIVFHTAALKHLTLLEAHPSEGVKTNVEGSANVIDAAVRHGVQEFVNISTDKAAFPTSVLGATKLLAERLTARAATGSGLRYVSVRFGNVLGSRGSVLPTFRQQIDRGGPITITHRDVERFFMTIPEAVRLVLQAGAIGRGGEIMVLDMGRPVKIVDIAERLIEQSGKAIEIEYTGLRDGEKMTETLVGLGEIGTTREHPLITHTCGSVELDIFDGATLAEPGRSAVAASIRELTLRAGSTAEPLMANDPGA